MELYRMDTFKANQTVKLGRKEWMLAQGERQTTMGGRLDSGTTASIR